MGGFLSCWSLNVKKTKKNNSTFYKNCKMKEWGVNEGTGQDGHHPEKFVFLASSCLICWSPGRIYMQETNWWVDSTQECIVYSILHLNLKNIPHSLWDEIHGRIMVHLHQKRSAVPKITDALDKEPFVKLQNCSRLQMFLDRFTHFTRYVKAKKVSCIASVTKWFYFKMEIYSTCITGVEDLIITVTFDDEHVCPTKKTHQKNQTPWREGKRRGRKRRYEATRIYLSFLQGWREQLFFKKG